MSEHPTSFTPKTALCLAAITVVGVDGEFQESELDRLRRLINTDEEAFITAYQFYQDRPLEMCIKVVAAALNEAQKRTTIAVMYDLANVDGVYAESENDLIRKYALAFELKIDALSTKQVKDSYDLSSFN